MTLASPASIPDLQEALQSVFGFGAFRAMQEDVVRAALDGQDVLVVMPTGAGKSLCFQLPAALNPGLTVVVSPLVALMKDQAEALAQRTAFATLGCACIHSLQSSEEQRDTMRRLREGRLRLVYIAPERFRSASFMEALLSVPVARFVIDEAHCISEWGHDFRPDYLTLKETAEALGRPPITTLTATATRRVQSSIVQNLAMRDPAIFVGGFNRPNLHFSVRRCKSDVERQEKLAQALPRLAAVGGSGLIYAPTRKLCEELADLATHVLGPVGKTAGYYHAGMESSARTELQDRWLSGNVHLLVATNAFGMGIDKPDVRYVIHCSLPDSMESYYQEAGRAGRDGRKSRCVVLYHVRDRKTREWFIENDTATPELVRTAHVQMVRQADGDTVSIPRAWWWNALGWSETVARLSTSMLERAGLVQRLGETRESTTWRVVEREIPRANLAFIEDTIKRQKDERYRRLNEMEEYCKSRTCRRRTMLEYFGDREQPEPGGFCCDNCETANRAATASYSAPSANGPPTNGGGAAVPNAGNRRMSRTLMPASIDPADFHAVLQGMDALRPALGKSRLNKLLRGSESKYIENFRDAQCPLLGIFEGCSLSRVDEFLESLVQHGLLREGGEEEYFVWTVTPAGRKTWQERIPVNIPLPTLPGPISMADGDAHDLFESLRQWRRSQAGKEGVPPYCIFTDRALEEIARERPCSDADLLAITGVGPSKVQKYGAAVLSLVHEHASGSH